MLRTFGRFHFSHAQIWFMISAKIPSCDFMQTRSAAVCRKMFFERGAQVKMATFSRIPSNIPQMNQIYFCLFYFLFLFAGVGWVRLWCSFTFKQQFTLQVPPLTHLTTSKKRPIKCSSYRGQGWCDLWRYWPPRSLENTAVDQRGRGHSVQRSAERSSTQPDDWQETSAEPRGVDQSCPVGQTAS